MEAEGSTNGAGTTENTAHIHSATGVRHAPPLQPRRLLTSIYAGAFSYRAPEERGWLLTGGGENLRDQWAIAITPRRRPQNGHKHLSTTK